VTTFDEREKGFESKFAHDQELEFKAVARRNRLAGLWAGGVMGLEGDHLEDYAEDVIRKLVQDLTAANSNVSEGSVRQKMEEFLAQARDQIRNGV
jgi:hypothetical protein